jgi:hypothetical protein
MRPPIEFVDSPGEPPPSGDDPPERTRRSFGWVGAGLVVLALLVWAVFRPHGEAAADRPAPSPSSSSSAPEPVTPLPSATVFPTFGRCPEFAMCTQSFTAPKSVVAAVRRVFPQATVARMMTVEEQRPGIAARVLIRRSVEVVAGRYQLKVLVAVHSRPAQPDLEAPAMPATASFEQVQAEAAGFTIDVMWVGPHDAWLPDWRLHRLAEDPALLLSY